MNLDALIDDAMNDPQMVDPGDPKPTEEAATQLKEILRNTFGFKEPEATKMEPLLLRQLKRSYSADYKAMYVQEWPQPHGQDSDHGQDKPQRQNTSKVEPY